MNLGCELDTYIRYQRVTIFFGWRACMELASYCRLLLYPQLSNDSLQRASMIITGPRQKKPDVVSPSLGFKVHLVSHQHSIFWGNRSSGDQTPSKWLDLIRKVTSALPDWPKIVGKALECFRLLVRTAPFCWKFIKMQVPFNEALAPFLEF